ncbi:MAG TPA: hypothetical protein VFP70_12015, partial [Burkholderiales bacterium]|nr:hypothetical protein [Burkholderiales bacterium]
MKYATKTLYAAIAVVCGLSAATAMAREFEVEVHKGNPTELVHGGGRGIVSAGGMRVEHGAEVEVHKGGGGELVHRQGGRGSGSGIVNAAGTRVSGGGHGRGHGLETEVHRGGRG